MQPTPLNANNPKPRTPWYAHVTLWMLIVSIALGGTFVVDVGHQDGPLVAAGLIGLALGIAGSLFIASLLDTLTATIDWGAVVLSIVFSAAVGLFFGIYPAARAAGLNPIDALRYE